MHTQFPLTLAWAANVHMVQGLSLEQGVIDFDLQKQKSFKPGQIDTALSSVKTYDNLYCIREFKKSSIKVKKKILEYGRPKQNNSFSTIKRNTISDDTIAVLVQDDIVKEDRITNNDIIGFTKSQINQSDSTRKIIETFNFFNIDFNNNKCKFLSLAYGCKNDAAVLDKFDANGVSILSLTKHAFADRVFTLMLVYRKQSMQMEQFFQMLQYLLAATSIDIVAGHLIMIF